MREPSGFAGVLGWPLERTLSPVLHNAAFHAAGLDWIYLRWPVQPERLADAVAGLRALGAVGANVTMPHKQAVAALLDGLSGDAAVLGAVNTIARSGDSLVGHNTDVEGFGEFLVREAGFDPSGRSALVLGAGGAARAVVKALVDRGASPVLVAARRQEAAEELAGLGAELGGGSVESLIWEAAQREAPACDLIVNATPLGASGEDPLAGVPLQARQCVVDLLYDPPATPLLERARAAGAAAWGGLGMLIGQAAASFRIWTGREAPVGAMSAAAVRALGRGS